ncbi:TPA: hypothetical protein DCY65_05150 [Candidatus Acetothermia bacterium]|nr:hypothetical protein [Candidatus Acetothermia bacterium]HAZ30935.1 hypothetical protein [Candidatus Acetothermia bacterium]
MDLWRIVLIAAVALGVVLLLLPGPVEIPGLEGGVLVEQGTYVVMKAGQRVGEEAFTVWLVDSGYRVSSTARWGNHRLEARLILDPAWNPLYYTETGRTPLSVRVAEGRPTLTVGSGLFRRETVLPAFPPFAFLGAEVVGPWFAVHRYLHAQARAGPVEVTAVLLRERTTVSLVGSPPEPVGLGVGERTLPAERYHVRLGEREIWLYGQGELLLAMAAPNEGLVFYLREMLPDGLRVVP